jgi:uncharacterized protein (DUF342 family)
MFIVEENVSLKNMNLHLRARHAHVEKIHLCRKQLPESFQQLRIILTIVTIVTILQNINSTINLEKNLIVKRENEINFKRRNPSE